MKITFMNLLSKVINSVFIAISLFALISLNPAALAANGQGRVFATPKEAVDALGKAVNTTNHAAFGVIFGPDFQRLVNPDPFQGAAELAEFAEAFNATNYLVLESPARMTLEVGANGWPFPVPLVKEAMGWRFDLAAGGEEILNRRIGRNELAVLRVMRAYNHAQDEYARRDRDGDQVLEYAQRIVSTPGLTDGLFWPVELNGEISPLGPLVAYAQAEGYSRKASENEPQPFHGYLFKILTRQGKHVPGGKYDYIINGNMIGGFAMVAWPAEYGEAGIMTFIVNQQGRVYQKDLGEGTSKIVSKLKSYELDPTWTPSPD